MSVLMVSTWRILVRATTDAFKAMAGAAVAVIATASATQTALLGWIAFGLVIGGLLYAASPERWGDSVKSLSDLGWKWPGVEVKPNTGGGGASDLDALLEDKKGTRRATVPKIDTGAATQRTEKVMLKGQTGPTCKYAGISVNAHVDNKHMDHMRML